MVTQVDPETGKLYEKGEPMKTLRKYRMIEPELNGPIFAVQFGIEVCGNAKVGDIVYCQSMIWSTYQITIDLDCKKIQLHYHVI